jgi:hypothetical protein
MFILEALAPGRAVCVNHARRAKKVRMVIAPKPNTGDAGSRLDLAIPSTIPVSLFFASDLQTASEFASLHAAGAFSDMAWTALLPRVIVHIIGYHTTFDLFLDIQDGQS